MLSQKRNLILAILFFGVSLFLAAGAFGENLHAAGFEPPYALEFDGNGDYVETGFPTADLSDNDQVTFEFWLCPKQSGFGTVLKGNVDGGDERWDITGGGGRIGWKNHGSRSTPLYASVSLNKWQHVAITYDGGDGHAAIYVNGELAATDEEQSAYKLRGDESVRFGREPGQTRNVLPPCFLLSDMRIWNGIRTPDEIRANMYGPLTGDEEGLVGYWPLNKEEGDTAYDKSAGENHGEISGAEWAIARPFETDPPEAFCPLPSELNATTGESLTLGPVNLRNPEGEVNYQWYFNGEPIENATENVLEIPEIEDGDFGIYYLTADDERELTPVETRHVSIFKILPKKEHFNFIRENDEVVRIEPAADIDLPVRWFAEDRPLLEAPYNVSVEGRDLPVFWGGRVNEAYYVRFQVHSPPFELEIDIDLPQDHDINLQPLRYRDDAEITDDGIRLKIQDEGARVIKMESPEGRRHTPLIILAEPSKSWEITTGEGDFYDVSHLAGKGPDAPQTSALQEILNQCAESENGGVVYFGPGRYHTGHLEVGSNTQFFLAPGAVVYGQEDLFGYTDSLPNRSLVNFYNAENSGLAGPGVLDGNGHIIQRIKSQRTSIHLVRFRNSTNMYARDVMLRNAVAWTFHIVGCDDVTVDGARVIGDWGLPNVDGINPDNSRDVTIENVFISGSDDAVAVKAANRFGPDGPTKNVVVRDSVVMTLKTALKLGTESRDDIENVLFSDVDVIHSSRGLALWMRDGSVYSDIHFKNINMDLLEFRGEGMSGEPFRVCIRDRAGGGIINGLTFENINIYAPCRALFMGMHNSKVKDVTLSNIEWNVTPLRIKGNSGALILISHVDGLTAEEVTIDWRESGQSWRRFVDKRESSDIDTEGISHIDYPF